MFSSNTSQVSSGGYEIQRSLRFNSADSAYLNRTPASAGNRNTWTWSGWVKRSTSGTRGGIFVCSNSAGTVYTGLEFSASNELISYDSNAPSSTGVATTQVFRDFSAWYHIVWAYDTTQATEANRVKLFVNGVQVTALSSANYPPQNSNTYINSSNSHSIGSWDPVGISLYLGGYMTEVNFIDGQALTPSSFGAFDAQTGVWGPTRYAGSYGTNGFYLNFSDNSNTTAATLGRDYSGNSNNWTPNNFSVSAGAGNDSLVDVPTNWGTDTGVGGSVRGNYCTLNPLVVNYATLTYSNGNLEGAATGGDWSGMQGTLSVSTGKWYWEVTHTSADNIFIGIARTTMNFATINPQNVSGSIVYFATDGNKRVDGTNSAYGASFTVGDVIGVALDLDANTVTFYKNNASQGAISLASTTLSGIPIVPLNAVAVSPTKAICNFGQRPFAYTAPSGFRALNTQNLPTPTIGATTATQAGKYFNPVLYTGNGFPTSGTQSVSGVGFQPDWVWIKSRSAAGSNTVTDVVRGINSQLLTNTTGVEQTNTDNITALNSDGFSLGSNTTGSTSVNVNGQTYVAWNWKANGAGVTNTAGSITSTVSANTTSGFSIATFTGNGTAGATFGHGLGVAPKMVIIKSRGNARNWLVYHASIGATKFLQLDTTIEALTGTTPWNDTAPTSSVVTLGTSAAGNESGVTRVAYCFSEVPGYSRFGSYTGNGSTDGPFVFCGFRPAYVMVKTTGTPNDWAVFDVARNTFNSATGVLYPNLSNAEAFFPAGGGIDILSNGFKMRADGLANGNGNAYIFAAFASAPQKFALAR